MTLRHSHDLITHLSFIAMSLCFLIIAGSASAKTVSIEDLYHQEEFTGFSLSPNGQYVAYGDNRSDLNKIVVLDLKTQKSTIAGDTGQADINWVSWATDDRLLASLKLTTTLRLPGSYYVRTESGRRSRNWEGFTYSRMISINRDGSKAAGMMKDAGERLQGNWRLDRVTSTLPNDADHVIVPAREKTLNLYKVNIHTGAFYLIEEGDDRTFAFDVDRNGYAYARYDWANRRRYVKIFTRASKGMKWQKLVTVKLEDLDEFSPVGDTDTPGEIYVSGRPEGEDKTGIYVYDLTEMTFKEKVASHPKYDVQSAITDTAGDFVAAVYYDDRRRYDFKNKSAGQHIKALDSYFGNTSNIVILSNSSKGERWLLRVSNPSEPASIYVYNLKTNKVDPIETLNPKLRSSDLGQTEVVEYQTSDGLILSGYVTHPPGKQNGAAPLVVMPHGGPHIRDYNVFDPWAQYLATRGYRVFQPNYRGSSGYGKAFAELGYGEWGGLMQDDITDGVDYLIESGKARSGNICIIGASYGGYAALMGAIKTPSKYQCAASINGVSHLRDMAKYDKSKYGRKSEVYKSVVKTMGDPSKDKERMDSNSPALRASEIKIPVLIVHGSNDGIVPIEQGEAMRDALIEAGNPAEYLRLEGVDHGLNGGVNKEDIFYGDREALQAVTKLLDAHLTQ